MRHVDDADQAIGDGQAQRGQQQHAAQAQAGEQVADQLGTALVAAQLVQRLLRGQPYLGIGLAVVAGAVALDQRRQLLAAVRVAVLTEDADRFEPCVMRGGIPGVCQHQVGPDHVKAGTQAGIGLGFARAFHRGERGAFRLVAQGADGLRAHRDVGRLQQQAAGGAVDQRAQAVVQGQGFEFVRLDRDRLAGDGIDRLVAVLAHHADRRRILQGVVLQGLQDRAGFGGRCLRQRGQRRGLGVKVVLGQRLQVGLRQRSGPWRRGQQQRSHEGAQPGHDLNR
ncbi:hypothetical protein D9M69_427900 [compost metagenome]